MADSRLNVSQVERTGPGDGSEAGAPRFLFDLRDPDAWLCAERILATMPVATAWVPTRADASPSFAAPDRARVEARAAALGLQAVRWPTTLPATSDDLLLAATYAKGIGRVVAFCLAAMRQTWCAARSPDDEATAVLAGAACEMHPAALLQGMRLRGTARALDEAGVARSPSIVAGDQAWTGEGCVEAAAAALA